MMCGRPGVLPHCVFCCELVPEQEVGNVGNGSTKEHRNECSLCDLEWRYSCQSGNGHNSAGNRGRGAAKAEEYLKREDQLNDRHADDMRHIRQERSKREERSVARTHDEGEEPHQSAADNHHGSQTEACVVGCSDQRAHEAGFDEAGSEEFTADNQGDHAHQNLAHAFEEELEGGENVAEIAQADQLKDDRNDSGDNHCRDNIHTDMTAGDFGEENDQEERDDGQNGIDLRDLFVLFSGLRARQRLNIVGIKNPAFTLVPPALDEHVNERQDNDHTDKERQLVIDEVF